MAKKKVKHVPGSGIFTLLGAVGMITFGYQIPPMIAGIILSTLLVFFMIIFYFTFSGFAKKYLNKESAVRVIDIKNCLPTVDAISMMILILFVCALIVLNHDMLEYKVGSLFVCIIACMLGIVEAKHLAVRYLGVIVDEQRDFVAFAYDMESYTISDYITLRFIKDYCSVDTIPLSEINRLSRGRGVELYMHGDFGSRGLLFSSKQKRDEALAMIKELNSSNTKLLPDIEGY